MHTPRSRSWQLPILACALALAACDGTMTVIEGDVGPDVDARRSDGGIAITDDAATHLDAPPIDAVGAMGDDAGLVTPDLGALPAGTIAEAIAAPLGWFGANSRGERFCSGCEGSSIVLAVAAFGGDVSADDRLLEQIRHVIGGGRDPFGNGGYLAQWERTMTGMIAIARLTPRVWSRLDAAEQRRADLVMQATLVASAYTTSDRSYAGGDTPTGLDGDTNLNRGWNPNYREGMVGAVIVSTLYLGGAEATRAFLDGYDHDAFTTELESAGLENLHGTFASASGPSAGEIETAIEGYAYLGHDLDALDEIFVALTNDTFSGTVACGLEDGAGRDVGGGVRSGVIVEGCSALPNLGAEGQLKELDSSDANGPRSSITYAWDGFKPNLTNHLVLLAYGMLARDASLAAAIARVRVGSTDLFYKAEHGYRSYARGSDRGVFVLPPDGREDGYQFYRPLWESVVAPRYE